MQRLRDETTPFAADFAFTKNNTAARITADHAKIFFTVFFTIITHKYIWQTKTIYYGDNMKNRQPNFSDFVKEFDLPEDLCRGGYHIELFNDTVIVDGCKNVAEYSDGRIALNTGSKKIIVLGDDMNVKSLACSQVIITGRILSVELE